MNHKMRLSTAAVAILAAPIVVLAMACGGGGGGNSPSDPGPPPGGDDVVTVNLDDFEYNPRQIQIGPGTTVRFVLRGTDPTHTATAKDGRFDSGFVFENPDDSFEVTFTGNDDDSTYEYSCVSHADCCDMKGSIQVGDNAPDPDAGY